MSEPVAAAALAGAVDDLARAVKALRADLARRTRRLWWAAIVIIVVGAAAMVLVLLNLGRAVDDVRAQEAELSRARDASCVVFAGLGRPELLRPDSGPLARQIVGDSAEAARIMGCAG